MIDPVDCFTTTYAQARRKFLDAARAAGLDVVSYPHPLPGREAEPLAMDIVVDGDASSEGLLIVSSGCHGVEGYAGSGMQVSALQDRALRAAARSAGIKLLHIHALNPFGFSHLRRTTHENVDLNRNFHDFRQPLPANEEYRLIHELLLPEYWPPSEENRAALQSMLSVRGMKGFQAIVARGQHEFADGLFFGGSEPCWSNLTLRSVLRRFAAFAKRIAWIDLHTGLGPSGVGERILACKSGSADHERARAWWGPAVTSIDDDTSVSALVTGPMWQAAYEECPQAQYTGIAIEYGIVPVLMVLHALRADAWLHRHRPVPVETAAQIGWQMMQAFYSDSDEWRRLVLGQGRDAIMQAVAGLAASR